MDAATILALKVEDALELPDFSPGVRALVDALDVNGPDITLRDVATVLGEDPIAFARRICGELVLAEVRRLAEATEARGALN